MVYLLPLEETREGHHYLPFPAPRDVQPLGNVFDSMQHRPVSFWGDSDGQP